MSAVATDPPTYTAAEAARRLGTTPGTLRRWFGVFSPAADARGRTRYRRDEVEHASQFRARDAQVAAVLRLRRDTGRVRD